MTPVRAAQLFRSFVRSRQDALLGWPDRSLYNDEDLAYFDTLEVERSAGRLQIEGEAKTWDDFLRQVYAASRNSPGWGDIYESYDEDDRAKFIEFELERK